MAQGTLAAGTVTITDAKTSAAATDAIAIHRVVAGTPGRQLRVTYTDATGYTVTSYKADGTVETADTSIVSVMVFYRF